MRLWRMRSAFARLKLRLHVRTPTAFGRQFRDACLPVTRSAAFGARKPVPAMRVSAIRVRAVRPS